jgi:hypothetical protein
MPTLQEKKPAARERSYWLPALSQDPDKRSVQIGLLWTVLVHVLVLLLAPVLFRNEFSPGRFVQPGSTKPYDVEFEQNMFASKPVQPLALPQHFVEANPEGNNNIPDHTDNFAAQNQQAAQPVPDKDSTLHTPKTQGEKDFQNDSQIVSGHLDKPEPTPPPTPPAQAQQAAAEQSPTQPKLQVPLPGYLKSQGDNPDNFGTEAVKLPEPSTGADKHVAGDVNGQDTTGKGAKAAQASRPQPQPRPRLVQVRPAILQERPVGVSNVGTLAIDAHFSQFGDYLQELVDIVQIQWERILMSSGTPPKPHSHVVVAFRLTAQGEISEIIKVDGDAGEYGTRASLSAIKDPAPYRAWTKEMVAVLGEDQVITFTFWYW